jgi:hypothetical protein
MAKHLYLTFSLTVYNKLSFGHAGSGGGKFQTQESETLEGKVLLN